MLSMHGKGKDGARGLERLTFYGHVIFLCPLAHSPIISKTSVFRLNIFSRLSAIPASFSSAVVLETTTNAKNTPAINFKKGDKLRNSDVVCGS